MHICKRIVRHILAEPQYLLLHVLSWVHAVLRQQSDDDSSFDEIIHVDDHIIFEMKMLITV